MKTRFGPMEYAEAGAGVPILMIHGTGGGFDQGLTFAERLSRRHRVIAPSRFGYLRSSCPPEPTAENQADAFVDLLDHLGLARVAVVGGSVGALPAAVFAARHPERCAAMILLVPAMNLERRDPVEMGPLIEFAVRRLLGSDLLFWAASRIAPQALMRTLLATDPALLATVDASERQRAGRILEELMPIRPRATGMLNDAVLAGRPAALETDRIAAPVLIVSAEDDRFNTAGTARRLATRLPGARLLIFPTGGHIWLGHDEAVSEEITAMLAGLAMDTNAGGPDRR